MRFLDIIRRKRDGLALNEAEIQAVVDAVTHDTVPDYQVAAWLMAVYLNGMTATERGYLVRGMMHSGHVLDFSHLRGAVSFFSSIAQTQSVRQIF